jgi:hypothetical protein
MHTHFRPQFEVSCGFDVVEVLAQRHLVNPDNQNEFAIGRVVSPLGPTFSSLTVHMAYRCAKSRSKSSHVFSATETFELATKPGNSCAFVT